MGVFYSRGLSLISNLCPLVFWSLRPWYFPLSRGHFFFSGKKHLTYLVCLLVHKAMVEFIFFSRKTSRDSIQQPSKMAIKTYQLNHILSLQFFFLQKSDDYLLLR